MSWVILALTLGASITSMIHGVFMLFGSLSVSGPNIFGLPSVMLACLPVIAAVFALIGGIIAFNKSKWSILFLFVATGLCVPSRDTWLYGGLYFFAALLCFFLKRKDNQDAYYDYDYDYGQEDYFQGDQNSIDEEEPVSVKEIPDIPADPLDADVSINEPDPLSVEVPKLRRRMSKSCPECGAVVSRDSRFCPTCGTKLYVAEGEGEEETETETVTAAEEVKADANTEEVLTQSESENLNVNDGDGVMGENREERNFRVLVKPRRVNESQHTAASSYREFSKYANKGKKRSRSAGRKIGSMMLLVAAVGGAMYFLLGLRKLPPGDLPPMARTEVPEASSVIPPVSVQKEQQTTTASEIAEPVGIAVSENVLPDFVPDREPKHGIVTASNVNVRADHTTSSSRVTRLKQNTRVDIIGNFNVTSGQYSGIWYNIRTGGNEGWIYGKYLQPVGSGLPAGYSSALIKSFGSTRSQIIESLGNPTRNTASSAEWPGITAAFKGDDITRLRLTSESRELQNGLKTGMSQTALLQIMGYPSSMNNRTMNYNENGKTGLSIQLDRNNSISSITVSEI